MRRSKADTLETRRAILRVALDCFSTRGYALTTFNDIAKRIQLTKGAVFWHFRTKEDLLAELIAEEHRRYEPLKGIDAVETLEALLGVFQAWARELAENAESRQFMLFVMSRVEWGEALKESLCQKLEGLMISDPFGLVESCLERLRTRGVIETPLSSRQIAVMLMSIFFGVHREAWLHKREVDIRRTVTSALEFILQGIRRQ